MGNVHAQFRWLMFTVDQSDLDSQAFWTYNKYPVSIWRKKGLLKFPFNFEILYLQKVLKIYPEFPYMLHPATTDVLFCITMVHLSKLRT